jgi:cytochrome c oxidase cbb3-type subunit 3
MRSLRPIIFLLLLCTTAVPVRLWTQTPGIPANTPANPTGALTGATNQNTPNSSKAEDPKISQPMQAEFPTATSTHPAGDATAGARTFSTNCSGCHGFDGRGGERAHNIATTRQVMSLSDDDLISILRNGITGTGMPSFAYLQNKGITDVVAYLRVLQGKVTVVKVKGDAKAGHDLFYGKAGCAQCHLIKGLGGFMGPDLTEFASGMALENIVLAITKPDARLQPNQAVASLLMIDGTTVQGTARSEDNFTLTLQEQDGRFRTFNKQGVASIRRTGHSIMPRDYDSKLTNKELDDLVSYLVAVSADTPPKPARGRRQQ